MKKEIWLLIGKTYYPDLPKPKNTPFPTKICSKCLKSKSIRDFNVSIVETDGLMPLCLKCQGYKPKRNTAGFKRQRIVSKSKD